MKTRKFLCVMAALMIAAATAGCNSADTKLFTVSTEPVSETSSGSTETPSASTDSGELVPKINASKSTDKSDSFSDYGVTADLATNALDIAEDYAADEAFHEGIALPEDEYVEDRDWIVEPLEDPDYPDDSDFEDSQVVPQSGLLTAGVWNDNENWGFFTNLVNNNKITLPKQYGIMPTNRTAVTVTDKNKQPVVNAKVRLLDSKGTVLWHSVTDKNGTAYVFAPDNVSPTEVEIESGGKTQKAALNIKAVDQQTEIKTQNNEIAVTFDGEGKSYKQTEIMFVVDTTGSMGDELMFLQSEFTAIAEEVGTQNTKYSINFYRDEGDEYTTKRYPFSDNIQEIQKKLNSESANGGGDLPEAVAEVLDETVNDGGWSEESVKLMFLIFDAPPHDGKEQMLESAVKTAAEKGIRIIPVVSSNSDRDTELFGRCAAIATGGTYVFLTDDSGIGSSHLEPIIGDYKVEKLYDIIIRTIGEYRQ